jgi:glycosyltransferase involved in cell wall biosynthesis
LEWDGPTFHTGATSQHLEASLVYQSLRIALLVTPFTLRMKGGDHAPALARELLNRGHTLRAFGAPPSAIPRSGADPESNGASASEDGVGLMGYKPDAIIAYDTLSPGAWVGARTARRLSIPLVLVEVGSKTDRAWRGRMLQKLGNSLWGRYVRHTTGAVIALDPHARDRALERGFAPEIVSLLPTGVDLNLYRPGLASGLILRHHIRGRILLHAGQIAHHRGLENLITAFAHTVGQRADWSLVFAGEGPAQPELRAQIDRLGIGARVHWIGRPREEELPGLMSASTLLAVPGLDDSVRGQHIPRAMACGLPVITSDLPVLRFLVEHAVSGLVVPAASLVGWTDALRRASMSPDARKRWGQRARQIAEERLAWPFVAKTFESTILRARGELVVEGEPIANQG